MKAIADALYAAEGTRARTAKVAALAAALAATKVEELPFVARFLTGTLLATDDDRTLGTGGALMWEACLTVSGASSAELGDIARKQGDLGSGMYEVMTARGKSGPGLTIQLAEETALTLAESGSRADKLRALVKALDACSPLEARYFVRAIPRILRIRDDKTPDDIDTIDAVQAIWDDQLATGHREEAAGTRPKSRGRKSGYKPDTRQKSKQLKLFDD